MQSEQITHIDQKTAQQLDNELMSEEVGFTLDVLMELAGQGVANTVHKLKENNKIEKILVLVGPGNNGGDGIVSARHLKMMGFDVELAVLKDMTNPFFIKLIKTCTYNNINVRKDLASFSQDQLVETLSTYDLLIDSLLGFSYQAPMREPFQSVIKSLSLVQTKILSVDIPSGWNVEQGNMENLFTPDFLLSLTLPKQGVKGYKGRHFLGGRFLSEQIIAKYNFKLPPYQGTETIQEISQQ